MNGFGNRRRQDGFPVGRMNGGTRNPGVKANGSARNSCWGEISSQVISNVYIVELVYYLLSKSIHRHEHISTQTSTLYMTLVSTLTRVSSFLS